MTLRPGPVAMFGSRHFTELLNKAIKEKRTWYYGDHGYFNRFVFYRVTRNAYMHNGQGEGDENRLKQLGVQIEAWRVGGKDILICPPDPQYSRRNGFSDHEWYLSVRKTLRAHTDRPIRVRLRKDASRSPLRAALENCHAMVTHHSNAAVEALLMGVPVFVTGECSARMMAETDLTRIEYPIRRDDRLRFASVLAANQWTLSEIHNGECWRRIGHE